MSKKSSVATWLVSNIACGACVFTLAACTGTGNDNYAPVSTPTVDYVDALDVYSAPHKDSFLNQLAMNYRSYAIYNARTSGYGDIGELFAQKAVAAFSGEVPFPETLDNWPVDDDAQSYELYMAYNELMDQLKNDATETQPELSAEAQAKFDCWLSAAASHQDATARECRDRYQKTMVALRDCTGGKIVKKNIAAPVVTEMQVGTPDDGATYYPDTQNMTAMRNASRARDGVIIVNNVNVPEHLINPVPVQPMVFNQNIYGGDKSVSNSGNRMVGDCAAGVVSTPDAPCNESDNDGAMPVVVVSEKEVGDELVTREEFINMMMAMRAELAAINKRLDEIQARPAATNDKTMIKVQQIPLEPKQHVMEEIFEIRFDFDKAVIKPEYKDLIEKLATATQNNRNIKVSVVGHTDTSGSKAYNYALGGRRAEAVQKMLVSYGIPASQIVAVSSGEEDLKVQTPDGTPNAANRRVRVVKETHYTDAGNAGAPVTVEVNGQSSDECGMYGCE